MLIDYAKISGNTNLFLDYINDFEKVKKFYNVNFRDKSSYTQVFEKLKKSSEHRDKVYNIVKNQYNSQRISDKTKANLESLKNENTITIFTGQQIGIFGGPLYTIFKIFTVIKLAEELSSVFPDYNFVPMFWMAGDDHDFEEISVLNLINTENEIETLRYDDGIDLYENRGSVGTLMFDDKILAFKDKLKSALRETEFSEELLELIDENLNEGTTLLSSFRNIIFKIFDETGLVIFNPQDKDVKEFLKPIFKKELLDFKKHNKSILLTSADLDEQYHSQVKIKPINLFLSDENGRHLIEPADGNFRLKNKRKRISKEVMLEVLESEPERFSANVLLRPITQDYLFQNGFYIGGPSEVSYFAQIIPLYKEFGLQHPIIFPRAGGTIIESNIAKILMKYNLSVVDFIKNDSLNETVINSISEQNVDTIFNEFNSSVKAQLNELSDQLSMIDHNLNNLTNSTSDKIIHQLEVLKSKSLKAQERRHESVVRQIEKAKNNIYPNNNLQEREIGIVNFINKYGFDFFDWLYNEIEVYEFKHQILEL